MNYELRCRECGKSWGNQPRSICDDCFSPLEVFYDYDAVRSSFTREQIAQGPASMWRYSDLLPLPQDYRPTVPAGFTPLLEAPRIARKLGAQHLYLKNDAVCQPSLSFKDRVVAVALAQARNFGFDTVSCSSTGNLANAVAAAAAKAGIDSVVLIPANLEPEKILASAVYGGLLVKVDGGYDEVNRLASELAEEREDWAFVNVNVRPYYAEGSKTIGYEIAEDLGWRLPRQIVVPVASGAQLVKIDKAFREFVTLGLVPDSDVTVYGAQASGCAPVAAAYAAGHDVVQPVRPDTIAKSLAIGNPADGPYVLDVVRRTGGTVADAPDPEIVDSIRLLAATEGIFGETAVGVTIAVLRRLLATGKLDPAEETVIINSGDGLKTLNAVAGAAAVPEPIKPSLAAFTRLYDSAVGQALRHCA